MSTDLKVNQVARYEYNDNKTLKKKTVTGSSFSSKVSEETFTYDAINRVKSHSCTYDVSNSKSVSGNITYVKAETDSSADNRIYTYAYNVNGVRKAYSYNNYDAFNRPTTKGTTVGNQGLYFTRAITYNKTRVSKVADTFSGANRGTDTYGYDALGRITSHSYSSASTSDSKTYVYDSCGQLVRENNSALDKTFIFCYDNIGNITSVKTYAYTTDATPTGTYTEKTYTYDSTNKDRLTNFNGNSITYNSLGCPQYYDNKTWTWTKGKLTRIHRGSSSQPGSKYEDCTFTYDAYGRRTQKYYIYDPNPAVAGDGHYYYKTNYNYDESGRLIREFCTEYRDTGTTTTREFVYLYDESGIIGVMYSVNGAGAQPYFYRRNLQGDVIAIYDQTGSRKVEYAYDAFGNCTVKYTSMSDLANSNPIRYRGYYYDRETKLYYLNARYYNPDWRRFISPDDTSYIDPDCHIGLNLYTYCNNDPVNYYDPSGYALETVFDIGFAIWSLIDFIKDPTWANAGWLALDVVALVVPFLPAGGKVITKADDLLDVVGFVNKYDEVIVLGQSMTTRVIPYADEIGAAVYGGLTNFKDLEKAYGTVLTTFIGYSDNMAFIIKESLKGAKFIDIGFDATRTLKGLKGMDLFTEIASRVTIYSERFFAQLFRKKNVFRYFRHKIF